ncbi:MAG: glucose-1-phosphate adenylyltransferase [Chloroflexi bacterium]|nr:glucose-1-phosphate adenylyltransferase [Chloroflexota bacterium]
MTKMTAMVLAGGQGKRMDMLCHMRPKPSLPFAGGFRVIDFSLSNCIHSDIGDIAVLTDYQRSYMTSYLSRWKATNANLLNFDILEPRVGSYRGTADAIYQNLGYLQEGTAGAVLVLAGDHIYKMDYRKMLAFHQQSGADVTVGVANIPIEQAYRFGAVKVDAVSRIMDFVEKSPNPPSTLASMGIYIFDKKLLFERIMEDAARPDSPHDFGYAIIPEMVRRDRVFAYRFDGYWQDIGTVEAYYAANMELIAQKPSFSLNGNWPVLAAVHSALPVKQTGQGNIVNSLVSPGCVIKGHVENSVLSPGVWVEEQAVIRNSVLMSDVFVGYHSVVDRCIVDEKVDIGKYCYVGFGSSPAQGERDITVVGKGATVPSHTAIGRKCKILPQVKHSDFHTNTVLSGSTVYHLVQNVAVN